MIPSFVGNNLMDYMLTNAKYLCKFFASFLLGLVKLSNLQNRRLIEYRHTMITALTNGRKMSSLRNFVRAVILVCAKKKMIGVYTKAVIAFVANKESFGDFPNVKRIRKAMSKKLFSVMGASRSCGSIAIRVGATLPVPAV